MQHDVSVVLASNRGPVSFVERAGGFDVKRGAGGLSASLDPVARRLGERAVWIATATSDVDRQAVAAGAVNDLPERLGYRVHMLDVDPGTYASYYDAASNRMLWFANHCLWDELGLDAATDADVRAWAEAYEPVNEQFARAVAAGSDPSWLALFQDYHLTTAPRYLRDLRPDQMSLHFTHSSFCCPGLRALPAAVAGRVLEGLLACDLVGFHTHGWALHFLDCCEAAGATVDRASGSVGRDGSRTWVRTYPIPIDAAQVAERAAGARSRAWVERFTQSFAGTTIVRADRIEPSKNIVRGFAAFGRLLDRRRDLRDEVRFLACLYPSRESMPEYVAYHARVADEVEAVNARHPGAIALFTGDDFDRTLAALAIYDVLLVNSLMDGMNLVAKEGPTVNRRDGVVVLSTSAGAYEELGPLTVGIADPSDVDATADALEQALATTPADRAAHAAALRERIARRRPDDWIGAQIDDLVAVRDAGRPRSSFAPAV